MNFNGLVCVLLLEKIRKTCQIKKMQLINMVRTEAVLIYFEYKQIYFKRVSLCKEYRFLAQ